jgi:ketosteroid isomerase-like protein
MAHQAVKELLNRQVDDEEYREIRRLWLAHSIAEDRRDIPGLMATLTEDCVYHMPQTGHIWRGKTGATQFYTDMLGAFPDVHFDLTNIVIGPQGVWEEALVTATHLGQWMDYTPSGNQIELRVTILFPWDRQRRLFLGERVHIESDEMLRGDGPTRLRHT